MYTMSHLIIDLGTLYYVQAIMNTIQVIIVDSWRILYYSTWIMSSYRVVSLQTDQNTPFSIAKLARKVRYSYSSNTPPYISINIMKHRQGTIKDLMLYITVIWSSSRATFNLKLLWRIIVNPVLFRRRVYTSLCAYIYIRLAFIPSNTILINIYDYLHTHYNKHEPQ